MQADVISLSLPAGPGYAAVARIVVGGLATRLEFAYEALDDLQLAVESVLADDRIVAADEVEVRLTPSPDAVVVEISPLRPDVLDRALDGENPFSLSVVLAAVVDDLERLDDDGVAALRLVKRLPPRLP